MRSSSLHEFSTTDEDWSAGSFTAEYRQALQKYIGTEGEPGLHRAYVLGRQALEDGRGILEIQRLHSAGVEDLLRGAAPEEHLRISAAAAQFITEFFSPFEMTFRGLRETLASLRSEIAERQSVEAALQRSERYYKSLIENALEMITILDREGKIRYMSRSGERILGYDPADLIGTPIRDLVHPEDVGPFLAILQNPGPGVQSPGTVESRFRRKTDGWATLESISRLEVEDPRNGGIIVSSRDNTERRHLEEVRRRYEFIVSASQEYMLLVNARREFEAVNAALCAILRKERGEILGRTLRQVFESAVDGLDISSLVERCFAGAEASDAGWVTFPGQERRYVEIDCYPYRNVLSAVTHAAVIVRDATGRRSNEERIREAQRQRAADLRRYAQLIQQAHEEERLRISRELHDDICQRLTALKLRLEVLEDPGGSRARAHAGQLRSVKGEIDKLIDEIRRMSSNLRPAALDHFGLATALRFLCSECTTSNGPRINFETNLIPHRRLDPGVEIAFFRVAQEAIANCLKHSAADEALITITETESEVTMVISDRGRGFNVEEYLADAGAGRHFGLLNMRERIELCGGRFDITARPGGGTTVTVSVPVTKVRTYEEDFAAVRR